MATNKVKFSMSIEKINFNFEGDYEKGQVLQQGISNAISGLAHLQSQAMGAETPRKLIEGTVVDTKPSKRGRRRRSSTAATDGTRPQRELTATRMGRRMPAAMHLVVALAPVRHLSLGLSIYEGQDFLLTNEKWAGFWMNFTVAGIRPSKAMISQVR